MDDTVIKSLIDQKIEHRVNELEKDNIDDRATSKEDLAKTTERLSMACEKLVQFETKLENLWQWKLYQNGILTDIRNSLNYLWLKIIGGIIGALILNFIFTRS